MLRVDIDHPPPIPANDNDISISDWRERARRKSASEARGRSRADVQGAPSYRPDPQLPADWLVYTENDGRQYWWAAREAANDNIPQRRWPFYEEYQAGRLGDLDFENEMNFQTGLRVMQTWDSFRSGDSSYFSIGTSCTSSEGRAPGLGNPLTLRGPERYAHYSGMWRQIDRAAGGALPTVMRAVVLGAEMHELAPDVINRRKRAAAGRARLVAALPAVGTALNELDLADAA